MPRDIPGQFAKAITSTDDNAKLHLQGGYAVSLSDAGYNLLQPHLNRRRFDPRNQLKMTTQCAQSYTNTSISLHLKPAAPASSYPAAPSLHPAATLQLSMEPQPVTQVCSPSP